VLKLLPNFREHFTEVPQCDVHVQLYNISHGAPHKVQTELLCRAFHKPNTGCRMCGKTYISSRMNMNIHSSAFALYKQTHTNEKHINANFLHS